jgi:hypothetical protein
VDAERRRQASIVRYWRAVEVFTPGEVKCVDYGRGRAADKRREGIYAVEPGKPLPWQAGHSVAAVRLEAWQTWQHVVYGGVFGLDLLYARMEKVFGASDVDFDERLPRGDTALFSMVVDAEGHPDLESLVLSTAAWGLGRADKPGPADPTWLDGFEQVTDAHRELVTSLVAEAEAAAKAQADVGLGENAEQALAPSVDDAWGESAEDATRAEDESLSEEDPAGDDAEEPEVVTRSLGDEDLRRLVLATAELVGLSELTADWRIRVQSRRVPRRRPEQEGKAERVEEGFLNSFHLEDLDKVAKALTTGDCGEALCAYLTDDDGLDVRSRRDVRDDEQRPLLRELLSPSRVPAGRWPAKESHPLAASQQLAVGQIVDRLAGGAGIFAVNGPPGTGKTTMLRDLLAAVVVARAERLAALPRPGAAFTGTLTWKIDRQARTVRTLDPALTGFEMVIASENNGAVENVTRQIPGASEIDESWRDVADYFAEHAERLLGEPAWGLVAAPLGNMANRQRFVKQFWFGDPDRGPDHGTPAGTGRASGRPPTAPGTCGADPQDPGFRGFLRAAAGTAVDWAGEVRAFREVLAVQEQLRAERAGWDRLLTDRAAMSAAVPQARARLAKVNALVDLAQESAAIAARGVQAAEAWEQAAVARRAEHLQRRPRTAETVLTWGKAARRWHAEDEPLAAELAETRQAVRDATHALGEATSRLASARTLAQAAEREEGDAVRRLRDAEASLQAVAARWGKDFPDHVWWDDERRRELSGPWLDEAWNAARSEVFLAALRLHEVFITATADVLRRNLGTTAMLLRGQVPRNLAEPVARAAWQSLFLVVPVVSTTFASAPRLFRHLSREALGWLFIDEAGQARPQSAVGAIWRSRRVVAVGDPLQLEPVLTVLNTTQQALRRHYGVTQTWTPAGTCVQSLADRLNTLGTWLPGPEEPVWVGAPLRVHRRCDEPMFSLVNRLAYGQMMVHATPPREHPLTAVDTRWVDVSGPAEGGNWVPAEGEAADQILDYLLRQQGLTPEQIFVISPFRAVVQGLESRLRAHRDVQVSTVHKTQGQERDVVLLVLGSDPDRPGARAWAAQKPNLLNVAVSRARQRLYVIGNHSVWSGQPHFGLLARSLDHRPFTPRQR